MDRLEELDLVYRERLGQDRRVVQAKLTPAGRELIASVFPTHTAFIGPLASHLTAQEQEDLRRLLKKLGKGVATES